MARKIKASFEDEAGFVCSRSNEITRGQNILYDGKDAGFDVSNGRWSVFCVEHGSLHQETNKQRATKLLKTPTTWCRGCSSKFEAAKTSLPMKAIREHDSSPEALEREMRFWALKARNNPEKCRLFKKMYGVGPEGFWT